MAAVPQYFMDFRNAVALKPFLPRIEWFLYLTTREVNIPNHNFAVNEEFVPCNLPPIHGRELKTIFDETEMKLHSLVLKHLINKLLQRHV